MVNGREGAVMGSRPVLSVVDYDAWNKGYQPPCEHVLVHELSHGGARVPCMSSLGDFTWWLVVQGNVTNKRIKAISRMLHEQMEILEEVECRAIDPALDEALRKDYGR